MKSAIENPRWIRPKDVVNYLGIDKNTFNKEVRPYLTEIPLPARKKDGKSNRIAFDRVDLDAWADDYKRRNGRPAKKRSKTLWDANGQVLPSVTASRTLTRNTSACGFAAARKQVMAQRRQNS